MRTERDVVEMLAGRAVTIDEMYEACRAAGVTDRDGGHDIIHGATDERWKRRTRNAVQALRRSGRASRVGPATWVIDGDRDQPRWSVLVLPGGDAVGGLAIDEACALLDSINEPVDLILTDPPYGLRRGCADADYQRTYQRDHAQVVPGYVDVDPDRYGEFMHAWIAKAGGVLRPGGQLVVVTSTEQAWRVGHAAHDAGLGFVTQVAAHKVFPMRLTRRPAFAHFVCSVFAAGGVDHRDRFFSCPPELPKAKSGRDYPHDVWDIPRYDRRGMLRYDNALPPVLVSMLMRAFSAGPDNGGQAWHDLVVDPFIGSGTTAVVAARHQRRFLGGDINPDAVRFTMARVAAENAAQPTPVGQHRSEPYPAGGLAQLSFDLGQLPTSA